MANTTSVMYWLYWRRTPGNSPRWQEHPHKHGGQLHSSQHHRWARYQSATAAQRHTSDVLKVFQERCVANKQMLTSHLQVFRAESDWSDVGSFMCVCTYVMSECIYYREEIIPTTQCCWLSASLSLSLSIPFQPFPVIDWIPALKWSAIHKHLINSHLFRDKVTQRNFWIHYLDLYVGFNWF